MKLEKLIIVPNPLKSVVSIKAEEPKVQELLRRKTHIRHKT
jgi:hypothetical protein